jgi:hypothetical protein
LRKSPAFVVNEEQLREELDASFDELNELLSDDDDSLSMPFGTEPSLDAFQEDVRGAEAITTGTAAGGEYDMAALYARNEDLSKSFSQATSRVVSRAASRVASPKLDDDERMAVDLDTLQELENLFAESVPPIAEEGSFIDDMIDDDLIGTFSQNSSKRNSRKKPSSPKPVNSAVPSETIRQQESSALDELDALIQNTHLPRSGTSMTEQPEGGEVQGLTENSIADPVFDTNSLANDDSTVFGDSEHRRAEGEEFVL